MKEKGSKAGWGFWLGWVAASTVGWFVGFIMAFIIGLLIAELFDIEWLTDLVMGIMFGIGVGVLQWVVLWIFLELQSVGIGAGELKWPVLWRRIAGAGWWVLGSAAAGAAISQGDLASYYESLSFGTLLRYIVVVALGGAVAGILQWLVLRSQVSRAGWWVLASTVGWALGIALWDAGWDAGTAYGTVLLVGGPLVLGVVTGAALVWLLRQPVPEAQLE
jgi:hypothetical protein